MPRPVGPARDARGFGLAELMVTLVVMSVVLAMVFAAFIRSQNTARSLTEITDARQNARAAVQLLERDIRMSGSGWGRLPVHVSWNGVAIDLNGVNPGFGGAGVVSDSVVLLGGWGTSTALSSSMPNPSSVLKVSDASGFADGDLCVITNGTSAHLFQVTQVNTASGILQHNPASPYNDPAGFAANWPAGGGYGGGAQVYRVSWVAYRFDTTNFGGPCVVRQEFGQSPQVAAWNVARFQMWYRMQDASMTRDPQSIVLVDKIVPVVHTEALSPSRRVVADSVWAYIRPRTF